MENEEPTLVTHVVGKKYVKSRIYSCCIQLLQDIKLV